MQIFQLNMAVKLINSYLMTTFSTTFLLPCYKTANISQINQQC